VFLNIRSFLLILIILLPRQTYKSTFGGQSTEGGQSAYPIYGENGRFALVKTEKKRKKVKITTEDTEEEGSTNDTN